MGIQCKCGTVLKDEKGLKKHRRHHCKVDRLPAEPLTLKCPDCDAMFAKPFGLSQHRRQAHKSSYNSEGEAKSLGARKQWTPAEELRLAKFELQFRLNPPSSNMNCALGHLIGRSQAAVKKRRLNPSYRKILSSLEQQESEYSSESLSDCSDDSIESCTSSTEHQSCLFEADEDAQHCSLSSSNFLSAGILNESHINRDTMPPSETSATNNDVDPVKDFLTSLCSDSAYIEFSSDILEILHGSSPEVLMAKILGEIKNRRQNTGQKSRSKKTNESQNPQSLAQEAEPRPPNSSRRKKRNPASNARAFAYKRWQELYKKDKKTLTDLLFKSSSPDTVSAFPPIKEIEKEYSRIFGSPSPPDDKPAKRVDYGPDTTYQPISLEDVIRVQKSLKPTAPGPDKVDAKTMQKVNPKLLVVLFNIMLFTGHVPSQILECRTTLIPKSGDPKDVGNWRPITVSSLILRTFNKIIAKRLSDISIHCAQKGFRSVDGCLANTFLLQTIIKERRQKAQPYSIITLDLKKAFDSVSVHTIPRALRRVGVHEKTIKLINNMYSASTTVISCGGQSTIPIPMSKGLKQGDPLSPPVFNLAMDEALCDVDLDFGVLLEDCKIAVIAYADDLVVVGPSFHETQCTLDRIQQFLIDRGLEVNIKKCTALCVERVPKLKKLYIKTTPTYQICGNFIQPVTPDDTFKYLGHNFDYSGISKVNLDNIKTAVTNLQNAPLKPQQKLVILVQYILPRALADLQYPSITAKTLRECDSVIRNCAKHFLHLPKTTSNSFFYTKIRDGGLGFTNLEIAIPIILRNRLNRLSLVDDPLIQAAISCSQASKLIARLEKLTHNFATTKQFKNSMAIELDKGYSGNGLLQGNQSAVSGRWVMLPPPYWSGRDFVRAIQLRSNMLPTRGIPSNPTHLRRCRAGCFRNESLSHVLQGCPSTHWERINRHDRVVNIIKKAAEKSLFKVDVEPRIRCTDGTLVKPDLVMVKDNDIIISDVGVHWEGPRSLNIAYTNKVSYYGREETIGGIRKTYGSSKNILLAPCIVGARGIWCPLNKTLVSAIKLSTHVQEDIITDTLKGGWTIHSSFFRRTFSNKYKRTN